MDRKQEKGKGAERRMKSHMEQVRSNKDASEVRD